MEINTLYIALHEKIDVGQFYYQRLTEFTANTA